MEKRTLKRVAVLVCPFCPRRYPRQARSRHMDVYGYDDRVFVQCTGCGAVGPSVSDGHLHSPNNAIAAWNDMAWRVEQAG